MGNADRDLDQFVHDALARGATRGDIEQALGRAGWTAEQAQGALAAFADVEFPVPVPRPRPYLSARDAFLYLVLFTTLYLSAWHFGSLLFDVIDHVFPDPSQPAWAGVAAAGIRWSVATIVIAFPVFVLLAVKLARELVRQPMRRLSAVRRWLTYLTLFIAAAALIGDLITLVYNLLGGEITVRFVLKALVVGLIALTVFGYYLRDLRRDENVT
jgi:hypothetical protein